MQAQVTPHVASRDEAVALAVRRRARPVVSRAHVGRAGAPQALPAARLDGRVGVVPVPGRRARARVARARARLARLRLVGDAAGRLLVSRLRRRPRCARRTRSRPDERVDVAGHSLGGNVAMLWAGARPDEACAHRLARRLRHSRRRLRSRARRSFASWLDALRDPPSFAPYASLAAVADRLQKTNPTATARQGGVPGAALGRERCPTARRGCARIRGTSCRSRRRRAWTTSTRSGAASRVPCCGSPPTIRTSALAVAADGDPRERDRAPVRAHAERDARVRERRGPHAAPRPAGSRGAR